MLDYILSKMVLLIFLLLLVAAFAAVRTTLNTYFVNQSAHMLASNIASDIQRAVTSIQSTHEVHRYQLPGGIRAGQITVPYDLNIIAYSKGSTLYAGILVLEQRTERPIAFDNVPLGPAGKTDLSICRDPSTGLVARSAGTRQQYFVVERDADLSTGKLRLRVCVVNDPNGVCSC